MPTPTQRAALEALRNEPNRYFSPRELAAILDTSAEGAARTASSLVRRGLVRRFKLARGVTYLISNAGLIEGISK